MHINKYRPIIPMYFATTANISVPQQIGHLWQKQIFGSE
jgi:hypothetical protein